MQVHSRLGSELYHSQPPSEQDQIRANGTHSDSRPNYPAPTNGHLRRDDMHPYQQQQHYAAGPPPTAQQRQYSANQLPPPYPGMNISPVPGQPGQPMPGPSNMPHNLIYHPLAPPPPPPPGQPMQHQDQQGQRLSFAGSNGKYNFELRVEQQPQRARMCGFGDKDRRPITPPPCIKLVITDQSGNPVETSQIDGSFFVLQVDLWNDDASREVNIVRSSSASPALSISAATTTSYPPPPDRPVAPYSSIVYMPDGSQTIYPQPPGYHPQQMPMQYPNTAYYGQPYAAGPAIAQYPPMPAPGQQQSNTMFTRNLIGSLTVNASVLKDLEDKTSFWFVLQDLSVRTEGWFRLKMNFISVAAPDGEGLNKGRAPVLAYVFSDKFQVHSAKKFPGVVESTPLSKCFAAQGIKIPIRKDVKAEADGDDD